MWRKYLRLPPACQRRVRQASGAKADSSVDKKNWPELSDAMQCMYDVQESALNREVTVCAPLCPACFGLLPHRRYSWLLWHCVRHRHEFGGCPCDMDTFLLPWMLCAADGHSRGRRARWANGPSAR